VVSSQPAGGFHPHSQGLQNAYSPESPHHHNFQQQQQYQQQIQLQQMQSQQRQQAASYHAGPSGRLRRQHAPRSDCEGCAVGVHDVTDAKVAVNLCLTASCLGVGWAFESQAVVFPFGIQGCACCAPECAACCAEATDKFFSCCAIYNCCKYDMDLLTPEISTYVLFLNRYPWD